MVLYVFTEPYAEPIWRSPTLEPLNQSDPVHSVRPTRYCTNHCPCSARETQRLPAARDHPSPLNHSPFTSTLPHAGRAEANPARRIHERACHTAPTNDSQSVPGAATVPAYYILGVCSRTIVFQRLGSPFSSILPGPLPCLPIPPTGRPQHPGENMIGSHDPSRPVLKRRQHLIFVCMKKRAIVTVRASPSGMVPPCRPETITRGSSRGSIAR
jgi:hypothetical protein